MSRHRETTWRTFEYNKIIGIWPNEGVGNSCGYAPMAKVVGDKRWMTDEKRREIAELMASAPDLKKENERLREENKKQREKIMLLNSMVQTEHEIIHVETLKEGEQNE